MYSLFDYNSTFWGFWDQAVRDATKSCKMPMLIFKQDRKPTLAMVCVEAGFTSDNYIQLHKGSEEYRLYHFDEILQEDTIRWSA